MDDNGYMTSGTGFSQIYDWLDDYTDTDYEMYPSYGGIYYVITAPSQGQGPMDIEYSGN